MTSVNNLGHAVLIIGSIWLHFTYGLDQWITLGLCLLGVCTWATYGWYRLRERLLKAQVDMLQAKADYYRNKVERRYDDD